MNHISAKMLDGAIKTLGNSALAEAVVLFAYRLGVLDGQMTMAGKAEELLKKELPLEL